MSRVRCRAIGGAIAAVLLAVAVVAGIASGPAAGSLFADGGLSIAGLTIVPGDVAVLSPVVLQVDTGPHAIVLGEVGVSGPAVDDRVATVELVGYLDIAGGGVPEIMRGEQEAAAQRDHLVPVGSHVQVGGADPLAVLVLVRGKRLGTWRSDSVDVRYEIDGREVVEHLHVALGVCVVRAIDEDCDPGSPAWATR